ncbi:MAG: cytochrome PufQ [Paracoccaceae bacterium]
MSDMTSHTPLTTRRDTAAKRGEYLFYFTLILACAVPIACAMWLLGALRITRPTDRGPLALAWEQANIVTPKIFWA